MSSLRMLLVLGASLIACAGDNENIPNFTPPTVIAHAQCDARGTTTDFPGGAFDANETTKCKFSHEGCAIGARQEICQKGKSLAFPDCAPTAEIAGTAAHLVVGARSEDEGGEEVTGDGDLTFDVDPLAQAAIIDPAAPVLVSRELRDVQSFERQGSRMHVEVQSCRLCRGAWVFPEVPATYDDDVHDGDLVAASGNWVADLPQHEGWAEIHEATAIARVRSLPGGVSYILVNAFFVDSPAQRDDLLLDVKVPSPSGAVTAAALRCDVDPELVQRGCPCSTMPGVDVRAVAIGADVCRIQIHRGAGAPSPLPFGCVNTPPCHGGAFTKASCSNIFYGGAIRASFVRERGGR